MNKPRQCARIHLTQSAYFGNHEEFELTRDSSDNPWQVKHFFSQFPVLGSHKELQDITKKYSLDWLNRTIDELNVLELKTEREIDSPFAPMLDGLGFEIEIMNHKNEIYYYHYYEFLGDYSDVWRADAFWQLLKHQLTEGNGEEE